MNRCEECGAWNTGWRPVPHFGKWVCPACAQGVKRRGVEEELARRRGLLARLEAAEPYPGLEAFKRETRNGIERLEKRIHEQSAIEQQLK